MAQAPLVDPGTGLVTPVWNRFFLSLFARTGQSQGTDAASMADDADAAAGQLAFGDLPSEAEGEASGISLMDALADPPGEAAAAGDFLLALGEPTGEALGDDPWAVALLMAEPLAEPPGNDFLLGLESPA